MSSVITLQNGTFLNAKNTATIHKRKFLKIQTFFISFVTLIYKLEICKLIK